MKQISDFKNGKVNILLTDIDGTLTQNGQIPPSSYNGLWKLYHSGIKVIPVTGRPAGWCEMIARTWPVHGVIGENGGLYFSLQGSKMKRFYAVDSGERKKNRASLKTIRSEVLQGVPGAAVASDQFCRMFDLAIDFAEDVPRLSLKQINLILEIFRKHGAQAKVSNIHVNGWFGDYDKLTTCKRYLQQEFQLNEATMQTHCAFIGDSPNDEPMFAYFENSVAVANIKEFLPTLKSKPAFITSLPEADGFAELVAKLV